MVDALLSGSAAAVTTVECSAHTARQSPSQATAFEFRESFACILLAWEGGGLGLGSAIIEPLFNFQKFKKKIEKEIETQPSNAELRHQIFAYFLLPTEFKFHEHD